MTFEEIQAWRDAANELIRLQKDAANV